MPRLHSKYPSGGSKRKKKKDWEKVNQQHYAGLMHRFVITKSNIGTIEKESEQLTEIEHNASNEQLPVSNNLSAENSTSTCNNAVIENKEDDQPAEIEINEQRSIDLSAENCARTCNEPVAKEKEGELLAENEETTERLSHDVLAENDTSTFIQPAVTELVLTPNNSSKLPHELKDVGEWPPPTITKCRKFKTIIASWTRHN